ncbi:hypothetical protein NLM33_09915 [Bradyrhizobium sp. CCGUVB1N3]|uniref:hypothetical protein n=1 Tax=Bradyrhizobium sp. CCGUVB1N3 TaxID=2949629 RepID=UPI0020B37404|nr:hypothetical protein [Bradyrhizobium sp. CCGUVB1N3]MCP3470634.1 hypothetical protein [Bradyrhizobium sp. CCGUVB1N3]
MLAGLYRVDLNGLVKLGALLRPAFSVGRKSPLWLAAAVLAGGGAWGLMSASEGNESDGIELATVQPEPAQSVPPAAVAARVSVPAELDRLRISSQTWRRGGLGSRALVTFTLRNDNDYAVKDVEILCAFTRRDGSHLTDRRRVLGETVNMKSRKTFAHVQVGFVNVNASQAKCSLAAARRV